MEPASAAIKIIQRVTPSPAWIRLAVDAQLPVDAHELAELVATGAKVCSVSPELHPDYDARLPADAFMRSVRAIGIENFNAVCTKRPSFWSDYIKRLNGS